MKSLPVKHFLPPPARRDAKFLTVRNLITTIPTGLICRSAVQPGSNTSRKTISDFGDTDETRNGEGERPRKTLTSPGSLSIPKDGDSRGRSPSRPKEIRVQSVAHFEYCCRILLRLGILPSAQPRLERGQVRDFANDVGQVIQNLFQRGNRSPGRHR